LSGLLKDGTMGIVYHVDKEEGITYVVWDGPVEAEQWLAHVQRLLSDPDWPAARGLHLTDLRTGILDTAFDGSLLEEVATMFGSHAKISKVKTAIVAHEAFQKALLYERLVSRFEPFVIVFNDLGTACTWLGVNVEAASLALNALRTLARGGTN
jgi:hypothetical protein